MKLQVKVKRTLYQTLTDMSGANIDFSYSNLGQYDKHTAPVFWEISPAKKTSILNSLLTNRSITLYNGGILEGFAGLNAFTNVGQVPITLKSIKARTQLGWYQQADPAPLALTSLGMTEFPDENGLQLMHQVRIMDGVYEQADLPLFSINPSNNGGAVVTPNHIASEQQIMIDQAVTPAIGVPFQLLTRDFQYIAPLLQSSPVTCRNLIDLAGCNNVQPRNVALWNAITMVQVVQTIYDLEINDRVLDSGGTNAQPVALAYSMPIASQTGLQTSGGQSGFMTSQIPTTSRTLALNLNGFQDLITMSTYEDMDFISPEGVAPTGGRHTAEVTVSAGPAPLSF